MSTSASYAPVAAATGEVLKLAMQRLWLTGRILPAGARLLVQHVFRSGEDAPIEVIYTFPLPRDASLRRFRIAGDGFEAHSELKETEQAANEYEQGISRGSLSALARLYGDGLVSLNVGNIRPKETVTVELEVLCGAELRDDGFRFRFPFTLAPAYHAKARTAVLDGVGEIELPSNEFGDLILPRFYQNASGLHEIGFDVQLLSELKLAEVGSPSHAVRVRHNNVCLAPEKDVPNRDLVLDVRFESVAPQVLAGRDQHGIGRFAAIVPSSSFGTGLPGARRIVILLDRSGSMQGIPLTQARKGIEACLGALSENDSFGLIAFSNASSAFRPALAPGNRGARNEAHQFLASLTASGGTELAQGLRAAAQLLGNSGGDVLIFTDGQVFGTEVILEVARQSGVRLHCLGIGSASQDRFLALLARETGGVSRFVTPQERIDVPAVDLFASIGQPVATELKTAADVQPAPPSCVFAGTPLLLFGQVPESGEQSIDLTWSEGQLNLPVRPTQGDLGTTLWLLQGARLITDWESRYLPDQALQPLEKRKQNRVAARLMELSRTYGLASREMSPVAVIARAGDRPDQLPTTRVVPVGIPQDEIFGAFFASTMPPPPFREADATMLISKWFGPRRERVGRPPDDDVLLDLARRMESDGGMPGKDTEARAMASVIALLAFLSRGHTATSGAFRSHVGKLVAFLSSLTGLNKDRQQIVAAVLKCVQNGAAPPGRWIKLAGSPGDHWREVEKAVATLRV